MLSVFGLYQHRIPMANDTAFNISAGGGCYSECGWKIRVAYGLFHFIKVQVMYH
jgi:hypothetical protein